MPVALEPAAEKAEVLLESVLLTPGVPGSALLESVLLMPDALGSAPLEPVDPGDS